MASLPEFRPACDDAPDAPPLRAPALRGRITGWETLATDRPAWDALALCAAEPNPFYEPWYLMPSFRALDPARQLRVFRFEVDGQLAGIMPLGRPLRYYRWPIPNVSSWVHDNCFCGLPLVAAGLERPFWRALLTALDRAPGLALFLHLRAMPLIGPVHDALLAEIAATGRGMALVHREDRAMLASRQSAQAYFDASLSGKKRKELRRQFARLAELGEVSITRQDGADGIDSWIEQFLALELSGWKGRSCSALASAPQTAALARETMRGAAEYGRLERLTLALESRPIAMLATFLTPPGAYSFKTAFDENYARFSPGVLLQRENLAVLDRNDIAWTDSCASADHPMIDHIWRERRPVGRISIAIGGTARRAVFNRLAAAELRRQPPAPDPIPEDIA